MAYQLLDWRSVQSVLGRENSGKVPAAKTIWLWRARLKQHTLMETISAAVSGQLERAGFLARGRQIIDASVIRAPIQRITHEEHAHIKTGDTLTQWSDAEGAQNDVQARWGL